MVEKGTIEFLGQGILLVFHSNRPTRHHLATIIDERGQPTTNQPTASRHGLSQYTHISL